MVAGQCKERVQALSLWCPAPDLVYNLKEHLTLCGQNVSNIEKDGCADVEGLKLSLKFYQDACTLILIKRLHCLIKMFVPFMEIKTLLLRVSVVTSIKKFLRKEQNVLLSKEQSIVLNHLRLEKQE